MSARYDFKVRDDVDVLVTALCADNAALRSIGEVSGFEEVMSTILVAGCMFLRGREGLVPNPDAPLFRIAEAARLLGMHLAIKGCDIVVVPVGTPGYRPIGLVERDGLPAQKPTVSDPTGVCA